MARCRAEIAPDDIHVTKKTMARGEELASRGRPAQFKLKRKIEYMQHERIFNAYLKNNLSFVIFC